jgi:ribosomal protein L32
MKTIRHQHEVIQMTIQKTFFCPQCGTRLAGKKACRNCGFDAYSEDAYGNTSALGAGGVGWSDKVGDPRFAGYQSNKRQYIGLFTVVLVLAIIAFLLISGDLSLDGEGITVLIVISAMFIVIALYAMLGTKRKGQEWTAKIVNKHLEDGKVLRSHLIFQTDKGIKQTLIFDDRVHYDYYAIGDLVKQHNRPNLRALEKYDKRKDEVLFCPSCAYLCDARDHYCQACGSPLLKGK